MVRERGVDDYVRLLGQRDDIPRLMGAADIVFLTSISEGIPLTLIEGMAAGRPVVSTRVGGVAEVVVDGQTGLLAPAGEFESLAAHVLRLANLPEERHQMGLAGRARAESLFTEQRMHEGYRKCYDELVCG
jgi:glycosyltransferase involved in cell wall biosynthesis